MKETLHKEREYMPLEYLLVLDVDNRGADVARDHLLWMFEKVRVMRGSVRIRDNGRNRTPATAGAAGPLLIICHMRRYVPKGDAGQRSNVDPHLHGCRTTQDVDRKLPLDRDVLETQFVFF